MFLYTIQNKINNKKYVGITNSTYRRWREHTVNLNKNTHENKHLQAAWNKYGPNNFVFSVVDTFSSLDALNKAEVLYIKEHDLLNQDKGYNLTVGGNCFVHSTKAKRSISLSNEKSVISKCLKTGDERVYSRISDVDQCGFNPKCIASACNLSKYEDGRKSFSVKTHKKHVWMYLSDYILKPEELDRRYTEYRNTKSRPSRYVSVRGVSKNNEKTLTYKAAYHAEKDGFISSHILACCKGKRKSHKGYIWSYEG